MIRMDTIKQKLKTLLLYFDKYLFYVVTFRHTDNIQSIAYSKPVIVKRVCKNLFSATWLIEAWAIIITYPNTFLPVIVPTAQKKSQQLFSRIRTKQFYFTWFLWLILVTRNSYKIWKQNIELSSVFF